MSGFDNPISFKKITDVHISIVEASIREQTLSILTKNLSDSINEECDVLVDDEQLINHFGLRYAHNTSSFRFEEGDKILIKELVDYVKALADEGGINCGLHHFVPDIQLTKTKRRQKQQTKPKFPQMKYKRVIQTDETQLKRELINKVRGIFDCYDSQQLADPDFESYLIDESTVELHVTKNEQNEYKVYGDVHCPICKSQNLKNQKSKRVYYNVKSNGKGCWVMSNFVNHFKNVHKVVVNTAHMTKSLKLNDESDVDEMISTEVSLHAFIDQSKDSAKKENAGNEDDAFDLIVVDDGASQPETNNDSNQFEVLYSQLSEQITKVFTAVLSNSDDHEQVEFTFDTTPRKLTVARIASDGNCLFSSLAHQLWLNKIGGVDHIKDTKKLRADTVCHILNPKNFDSYEFLLRDRVYDIKKSSEIENLATECRLFVKLKLARNKTWGGSETLMAVSDMYATNIIVFNEDANCVCIKRAGTNHSRTIAVAFRFSCDKKRNRSSIRNHYESVCDMNADDAMAACNSIHRYVK